MLSCFSRVQLWDLMDCSPLGSSVHGILQARILEWAAMPSARGYLPDPGIKTASPALQVDSFTTEPRGKYTRHLVPGQNLLCGPSGSAEQTCGEAALLTPGARPGSAGSCRPGLPPVSLPFTHLHTFLPSQPRHVYQESWLRHFSPPSTFPLLPLLHQPTCHPHPHPLVQKRGSSDSFCPAACAVHHCLTLTGALVGRKNTLLSSSPLGCTITMSEYAFAVSNWPPGCLMT